MTAAIASQALPIRGARRAGRAGKAEIRKSEPLGRAMSQQRRHPGRDRAGLRRLGDPAARARGDARAVVAGRYGPTIHFVASPVRAPGRESARLARSVALLPPLESSGGTRPELGPAYCMNQPWLTTSDCPVSALVGEAAK